MKLIALTLIAIALSAGAASGQSSGADLRLEQEIRALEQEQVDALLRNDLVAMRRNQADDYVVNNPSNEVVNHRTGPIQRGERTYSSFTREIERVLLRGNAVIVMGRETVVPSGSSADAGSTIHRRFTNMWMQRDGRWLLMARHASVVCEPQ